MNKNIVNGFKYKHVYIYTVYIAHKDRETKKQIIIHSWRMPVNQTLVAQNGKVSACDAGDRVRSWVWKLPWRRVWLPTPVFLPGEFQGQRSLAGLQSMGSQRGGHDSVNNTHTLLKTWGLKNKLAFTSPFLYELYHKYPNNEISLCRATLDNEKRRNYNITI